MLSFRFHVISLIAVFLALGIGILMGTTVVNDFTIDTLEQNIADARRDVNKSQEDIGALEDELRDVRRRDEQYLEESLPLLVADRLLNQPVMVVAADGIDRDPVADLQNVFATAGASFQGTIWLNERIGLEDEGDLAEAARILGRVGTNADSTRHALLLRIADELVAPAATPFTEEGAAAQTEGEEAEPPPLLVQLLTAGFIDYQAPSGAGDDRIVPDPGTWFVFVGGQGARLAQEQVLYPLLRNIAVNGDTALAVAAEGEDPPGQDGEDPEDPAPFVGPLREDDLTTERISTVDNLDGAAGQAAVVYALQQLQDGVVGHFGVANGAQRLLPAPVPAS